MMFCPGFVICCVVLLIVQSSHGAEIIGGKEVEPHSLPYMALLQGPELICGGTLIHPSWVLTAAHCTTGIDEVILGMHSFKKKENEKDSRQVREVEKHFPHPFYDSTDYDNDLMLLKLDKPVKMTETVKCLKLSNTVKDPAAGSNCLVAGWGRTNNSVDKLSDVLRSVNVMVIERVKCNSPEYYGHSEYVITRDMVCAGSEGENEADTCQGDSGGPLLCNGAQVGVTSFGIECGLIKKPGVYSFLSEKQLTWITKTMKKSEI